MIPKQDLPEERKHRICSQMCQEVTCGNLMLLNIYTGMRQSQSSYSGLHKVTNPSSPYKFSQQYPGPLSSEKSLEQLATLGESHETGEVMAIP